MCISSGEEWAKRASSIIVCVICFDCEKKSKFVKTSMALSGVVQMLCRKLVFGLCFKVVARLRNSDPYIGCMRMGNSFGLSVFLFLYAISVKPIQKH